MTAADPVKPTTYLHPRALSTRIGANVTLATESFQETGSFKFRAAYKVVSQVPQTKILAASSGNFGQALAYACKLTGKICIVVMPATSANVKIDAVRGHGATVDLIDTRSKSRAQRIQELAAEHPGAYIASAFDDPYVIEGDATLGTELAQASERWDSILVPVGGGGLISGIALGLRQAGNATEIIGAEPALANDAARSLRAGKIIENESEPTTIADGARTISVGKANWPIIQREVKEIIEVSEDNIREAVRLLFRLANLKVEPTGALAVGALLECGERFRGKSVCCVLSGGNVDPDVYSQILTSSNHQPR